MNFCYDVPVKLFSSHLLVVAVFVLAPDVGRLIDALWRGLAVGPRVWDPFPVASRAGRVAATVGKLALIGVIAAGPLLEAAGGATAAAELQGLYRVESFHGEVDARRWIRVGISALRRGAIQRADGSGERLWLTIDGEARTMSWRHAGAQEESVLRYEDLGDERWKLFGEFDGAPVVLVMRREDGQAALLRRGFHAIQAEPFNR
jgi:hypothetical protein